MPAMCPVCRGAAYFGRLAPLGAGSTEDPCAYCHGTGNDPRESQGEAVRLFEPAPAQLPGQTDFIDRVGEARWSC